MSLRLGIGGTAKIHLNVQDTHLATKTTLKHHRGTLNISKMVLSNIVSYAQTRTPAHARYHTITVAFDCARVQRNNNRTFLQTLFRSFVRSFVLIALIRCNI